MHRVLVFIFLGSCSDAPVEAAQPPRRAAMTLSSPAFDNGAPIPTEFTADGADLSPPLEWAHPPQGTRALVLLMDDPDAPMGTWDHWVVFNLPVTASSLAKGASVPEGGLSGSNSWGRGGYGGPAPPPGKAHRYFFKLYAVREPLAVSAGATKAAVVAAMQGSILAEATWIGTYQR